MTVSADRPPAEGGAERSRRIELSVERQVVRRQRLIRLYLVLLAIPLAVAAAFLLWGRTDREIVEQEVEQQVKPIQDSYREIAPMIADVRGVGELLPEIRTVNDRLGGYEQGQQELGVRVAEVASEIGELKPAVAEAREAKAEIETLRREVESQQRAVIQRIDRLDSRVRPATESEPAQPAVGAGLDRRTFDALAGRTEQMEGQQAELSRRLERLAASGSAAASSSELQALKSQMATLERSLAILQREVREIRAQLNRSQTPR